VNGERGFAYIFLLIAVAIVAGASANALSEGSTAGRRHAEQELLVVGQAFEAALYSYAGQRNAVRPAPSQNAIGLQGPESLEELLLDPRVPQPVRHLRKLYADPLTGGREWGLVRDIAGRIVGIHSLSGAAPIKMTGFPPPLAHFEQASTYQDWVFGLPGAKQIAGTAQNPELLTTEGSAPSGHGVPLLPGQRSERR
jgi:type II secretory pathway pseudopilin PulG